MTIKKQDIVKKIFFAYQGSRNDEYNNNAEAIRRAIEEYNKHVNQTKAESWEEFTKTTPINKDILSRIDACDKFACDLTFFNHNVLFELGYAIGLRKQILILINDSHENIKRKYSDSFLKNIRYTPFSSSKQIIPAMNKNFEEDLLGRYINDESLEGMKPIDIFYMQSKSQTQDAIDLTDFIRTTQAEKCFSLLSDDTTEVEYKPLDYYFKSLILSKNIIIHLSKHDYEKNNIENAKGSFFAGLGCGLQKKVLLLAPSKYPAPLDYHDILLQYKDIVEMNKCTEQWVSDNVKITETQKIKTIIKERELNLLKLGIGFDVAEDEKDGLLHYFIETSAYNTALNYSRSIIVGRKGAGKSAIFIKLNNDLSMEKLNYIVCLKPESIELLEDVEASSLYTSQASKKSFFLSVWKLVIFSKLLISISDKILSKEKNSPYSKEENDLLDFYNKNDVLLNQHFFAVVKSICIKSKNEKLDTPSILQLLYTSYLNPLIQIIKKYFESINAKYIKIIILADNLDRAWEPQSDLEMQTEMILTLLEVGTNIQNALIDKRSQDVTVKEIIFLRKDIFDFTLKSSREPDKLLSRSHEINWGDYPIKLKEIVEKRFNYVMPNAQIDTNVWDVYFEFKDKKKHPFDIIKAIVTPRPRDIIYFITRLFESASNNNRLKVNEDDLLYSINTYTQFLNNNLIAETKAEFPRITEIMSEFQEYQGMLMGYNKFNKILKNYITSEEIIDKLYGILFSNGYLRGFDKKRQEIITNYDDLKKHLNNKTWSLFNSNIFIIPNADSYAIKARHQLQYS